ncbi:hypothetical protein ANN_24071 [Periplaneta americana]|uniref:Uncharacterized protein n=1 Tax=Periplaneta americana TaxID=6978 RepID=A0ABQ8S2E8_PERAM|nr:hypothetical protein ANN_24071 [Periplaneta americana]
MGLQQRLEEVGRGVELYSQVPKANAWIFNKSGLSTSEWVTCLKINANLAAVRGVPGRSLDGSRCKHGCPETETLAHVQEEEVFCLATNGSSRRIDIIAYSQTTKKCYIIDPTIRIETGSSQPEDVNQEKINIYLPTVDYFKAKYQLENIEVIGLLIGARASRSGPPRDAPPPYAPPMGPWYAAPPPAYAPPPAGYYGWVPPTHAFPDAPPPNSVFMTDMPPPYPGINGYNGYAAASAPPAGAVGFTHPQPGTQSAADAKAAEAAQSAYYDPNRPQCAYVPPPAYYMIKLLLPGLHEVPTSQHLIIWGFIKNKVRNHRYNPTGQLRAAVEDAFNKVTLDYVRKTSARIWHRIQLCCENEGLHTDVLDQ